MSNNIINMDWKDIPTNKLLILDNDAKYMFIKTKIVDKYFPALKVFFANFVEILVVFSPKLKVSFFATFEIGCVIALATCLNVSPVKS